MLLVFGATCSELRQNVLIEAGELGGLLDPALVALSPGRLQFGLGLLQLELDLKWENGGGCRGDNATCEVPFVISCFR